MPWLISGVKPSGNKYHAQWEHKRWRIFPRSLTKNNLMAEHGVDRQHPSSELPVHCRVYSPNWYYMPIWWNGRHPALRTPCHKACRFESCCRHQKNIFNDKNFYQKDKMFIVSLIIIWWIYSSIEIYKANNLNWHEWNFYFVLIKILEFFSIL